MEDEEYYKWEKKQRDNAEMNNCSTDIWILSEYADVIQQYLDSPNSFATRGIAEIATETVKRYLIEMGMEE